MSIYCVMDGVRQTIYEHFEKYCICLIPPWLLSRSAAVKRQRLLLLLVPAALLRYLGGLQDACAALLSGADASAAGVGVGAAGR